MASSQTPIDSPLIGPPPNSDRVQIVTSSPGTISIIGVTIAGRWVAEYKCEADEFDERCVLAMERRVKVKERKLAVLAARDHSDRVAHAGRVIPFAPRR